MRILGPALCFGFALHAACAAGQTLANDQFNVRYSSSGITSLKHVQDVYDTDYIASGKTLGDVLIRYRKSGETDWREAKNAHDPRGTEQAVSYTVGADLTDLAATETFQL